MLHIIRQLEAVLHAFHSEAKDMNMTPYLAVWSLVAAVVLGLAFYRKMLASREDDTLHVSEGASRLVPEQIATAQRIEVVEKWGKSLTAVVLVTGLILVSIYFYNVWQTGASSTIVK
ncbi:MAG TPA: hypothetical protein VGL72_00645 [Bryobacteraceae bacterium]|jgi:hypothetical protein